MIKGKNINLRLFKKEDINKYVELWNDLDEKINKNFPLSFISLQGILKEFNENGLWTRDKGQLLITDKNNKIIGDIIYFKVEGSTLEYELGYQIFKKEDRGKGYTTEAVKLLSAYLFDLKRIIRLSIRVVKENIASNRVAEKCGYKYEGTLRRKFFNHGSYADCNLYSLLREECPMLKELI